MLRITLFSVLIYMSTSFISHACAGDGFSVTDIVIEPVFERPLNHDREVEADADDTAIHKHMSLASHLGMTEESMVLRGGRDFRDGDLNNLALDD